MDGWVDGWVDTAQCNAITVDAIVEEQMEEEETLQWDSGFSFPLNFIIIIGGGRPSLRAPIRLLGSGTVEVDSSPRERGEEYGRGKALDWGRKGGANEQTNE